MTGLEKFEMRKIVPVAAMISAGKSKLLNVLYNINFLECKAGIGTKFVNLLRYNPNITEPRFYHLRIIKEEEKYIFYKDNLFPDVIGEKNIIEENKKINKILANDSQFNYENIFYVTELNDSPFIQDKEYLLTHDLCDIPGLSEYQENATNDKINEEENGKTNQQSKIDELKKQFLGEEEEEGIIKKTDEEKKEDEIYYNITIEENTYLSEIFKIIKKYIDGAIIVLSIQNYYFDTNFELIAKLHKVIQKEINNFLIILNKIDLSTNLNADINKCKGLFMKHFPSCKTFNLNLNTFIPLSTIQLQNELLLDKSFKHLLSYHFYNYIAKINNEKLINKNTLSKSFIDHLKDIIKTVKGITREEIEKKVNDFNNPGIDEEILQVINDLKNDFKGNDINFGISEEDFKTNENENENEDNLLDLEMEPTEENTNASTSTNNNIDEINPSYILKILYIYQTENKLIPSRSKETYDLLNYFKVKKNFIKIEDIEDIIESVSEKTKLNKQIIINLKKIAEEIKQSKFISNEITNIINEIYQTVEYLGIYDVIFIAFLGPSNAGKTTIINGIIGEEVLPADLNECTKRGIIIRYLDNFETEINIRKAVFTEEEFLGKKKYYFASQNVIAKGLKGVQETVKGLNYDFTDRQEDSFYYIRTKIKLFDDLKLDNYYKKMIYLIDFPGYGTGNIFEKVLYKKVMSICNSFVFVVRNSVIKENKTQELLEGIFTQARKEKKKLPSGFIKNCLFVLNNDNTQTTTENDLENAKKDISTLIKLEKNNINAIFFNAKYYGNYIDNFNYFYNLRNTLNNEYKKYSKYKNNLFKYPELYNINYYNTFFEFMYKEIVEKIKINGLGAKIGKNQEIYENVKNDLNETIIEFENNKYINKNEFSLKRKETIEKIFSYAQKHINELPTLKESNVNEFNNIFKYQINYVNNEIQEELKKNINKVITTLDYFFNEDFTKREKDLKAFNEFKDNLNSIIQKMKFKNENSEKELKLIREKYENNVTKSLEMKKENIKKLLKDKNLKEIKNEIDIEMKNYLEKFDNEIKNFFKNISFHSKMDYEEAKNCFKDFSEGKISLTEYPGFEENFSEKVADKENNVLNEISKEIRSCIDESMKKIYNENGLLTAISAFLFDSQYLSQIIELIIKYYTKHIKYIFDLIQSTFKDYIELIIHEIENRKSIISIKYSNKQSHQWSNLCSAYSSKKENIYIDLKNICNK